MSENTFPPQESPLCAGIVNTFISSLTTPFVITDLNGNIQKAGNSFFPLFEIGKSVIKGESVTEFIHEESRPAVRTLFRDPILLKGKTIQSSIVGLKRDGSPIQLLISVTRIENDFPFCLVIFEDRSEHIKELGKIEKLEHQAAIGTFTSIVAHEFNNVLAGIRGYAQLMKSDPSDSHLAEKASSIIEQETARGAEICRNLSLYSGAHRLTFEAVDPCELIGRCADIQRSQIEDDTTIEIHCVDIPPVMLDRHRMQQVLINLLINSRHAVMPKGGGIITIRAFLDDGTLVIQVEDNGIGIPAFNLSKVFDPFFSTKTSAGGGSRQPNAPRGTGLGLPVCQVIVKQHGGAIDVASRHGEGSIFTIRIPAKFAAAQKSLKKEISEIRALVVDDDMPVREVIFRALAHVNIDATLAHNATEMRNLIEKETFDIIFLDYVLPEMNADRLLPVIRGKMPDARIVIISAWSGSPAKKASIEKTVEAWIEKPFNVDAILDQLKPFGIRIG
jgi:PAS domain S-box-containing protein